MRIIELDAVVAKRDHVLMNQYMIRHAPGIDECAITAIEIHQESRAAMPHEQSVMATDEFAVDRNIVVFWTAN